MAAIATVALVVAVPSLASAGSSRSRGQFFVYDTPNCVGAGNSAKVTMPASVGGRGYPPNIDMDIYATDKNTNERFGPFVVTTNGDGAFCAEVVDARATHWKIDLVEPGSGNTDSKVVTVLAPPTPPTTTVPPTTIAPTTSTTTPATTTTTVGASTTTSQGTTTTSQGTTTTTVAPSTTPATTTTAVTTTTVEGSGGPPIDIEQVPVPPDWTLPATGAAPSTSLRWALGFLVVGALLVAMTRRARSAQAPHTNH